MLLHLGLLHLGQLLHLGLQRIATPRCLFSPLCYELLLMLLTLLGLYDVAFLLCYAIIEPIEIQGCCFQYDFLASNTSLLGTLI